MRVALLVGLAACSFRGHGHLDDASGDDDAGPCTSATPYLDTCAAPAPGGPLILDNGEFVYDTDNGTLTAPGGGAVDHVSVVLGDVRVIVATDVAITNDATLRAIGALPIAIIASGSMQIDGAIDVAGRATEPGAGGKVTCANGAADGTSDSGGAGGAGGGGFHGDGGLGGVGDNNGGSAAPGRGGGGVTLPATLRGGCPGGKGGFGNGDPGGDGGGAGGGLLLVVGEQLVIPGVLRAGGGGGRGGPFSNTTTMDGDGGGGGGASGGMIAIVAQDLVASGSIVANGGGGGEGGCDCGAGVPGADGPDLASAAIGGSGGASGGADGAAGGFLASHDGATPAQFLAGAGGGGGGGVGYIVIDAVVMTLSGTISPAAE